MRSRLNSTALRLWYHDCCRVARDVNVLQSDVVIVVAVVVVVDHRRVKSFPQRAWPLLGVCGAAPSSSLLCMLAPYLSLCLHTYRQRILTHTHTAPTQHQPYATILTALTNTAPMFARP